MHGSLRFKSGCFYHLRYKQFNSAYTRLHSLIVRRVPNIDYGELSEKSGVQRSYTVRALLIAALVLTYGCQNTEHLKLADQLIADL